MSREMVSGRSSWRRSWRRRTRPAPGWGCGDIARSISAAGGGGQRAMAYPSVPIVVKQHEQGSAIPVQFFDGLPVFRETTPIDTKYSTPKGATMIINDELSLAHSGANADSLA